MSGLLWEWCNDKYSEENYYANSPQDDPKGPEAGYGQVLRGGGYLEPIWDIRSSTRVHPETYITIGFRIARDLS